MKRAIGIDINKKYISLVQLCCKSGKYFMEKTFTRDISSADSPKEAPAQEIQTEIENAIKNEGFDTRAPAIASMPYGKVFFHNYRTEITADRDIERLIKFELEDDFPIPFDDLVIDICSRRNVNEHAKEFFVGAVSRSKLQEWFHAVSETGLNCSIITSDALSLGSFIKFNKSSHNENPSIIIFTDECRIIITVYEHGSVIFARHINNIDTRDMVSMLKREIELTVKVISEAGVPHTSKTLLVGTSEIVSDLSGELTKELDSEIVTLNPFNGIVSTDKFEPDDRLTIALGLAFSGLNKKRNVLNFLAAEKAGTEQVEKTKRNAIIFSSLVISIAAMFIINLFVRLNALEIEKQSLDKQIRSIFVQTFPDEKKIVNELAQMDEKYNSLEREYNSIASEIFNRIPALEILENISAKITPDENISVSDISMTADSVQISATAADFEAVDNLVEKFKKTPEFHSIEMGNIDVDSANNRVRFNLSMKVGAN